ncbi:MAG: tRNA epoxyqueuosine(34) reductase QueG [Acidimicrobiales bacterium]|nr:tRNA epoxyqueuosine(34) reductase QueG [Acidimicrobiales bacterium]
MLDSHAATEVCGVGRRSGLDAVGIASAEPFESTRVVLEERRAAGLHGGMQFTYRNPARSTDPSRSLPGARALVVGARAYDARFPAAPADRSRPRARVARYAVRDHYAELRRGLEAVADHLRGEGWVARVLADDNALVDRAAAHRAGLGWYGKNANILLPGAGSWFVLGAVLTDAPLPSTAAPVEDGCGSCRRCLDGCPTGAIVAPGVVDARRCLAWLVQAEGDFPLEHREALGDRIYGCDDCQEVCPPNRRAGRGRDDPAGGSGDEAAWVDVVALLDADDAELLDRFGRWYIPRRDPRYLRRNALVVLGNRAGGSCGAGTAVEAVLRRYLEHPDEMLRTHAVWAARRLGRSDLVREPAGQLRPAEPADVAVPGVAGRPGAEPAQPGLASPGARGAGSHAAGGPAGTGVPSPGVSR